MRSTEVDVILTTMLDSYPNVSDLNISVNRPLQVESSGQLVPVTLDPSVEQLTPFQCEVLALALLNGSRRLTKDLVVTGSSDSSYSVPSKARFRVNIFSRRGTYAIVLRKLETNVPSLADLGTPEIFQKVPLELNGVVLVTGSTGSGKSTTLAAMLNEINETRGVHVVTLEDPVEFVHPHKKSTMNQRELGGDFDTFATGLRAALRQAPKVIFVGEMRDRETVELGLRAAETGHLVMSTLHTVDAGQAINRVVGLFEQEEQGQVRAGLADTVRWIICQRLLPKIGGGRVAVHEIMGTNLRVRESIINGESDGKTFYEIIEQSEPYGWQTFDQAILRVFAAGLITEETAMAYASRKGIVGRGVDNLKKKRGEATTEIEGLSLDKKEAPPKALKRR
tara:strand:+ start:2019 stop:3200 length:1182 start_codon:yes stop_codon:yes gene_type:complete